MKSEEQIREELAATQMALAVEAAAPKDQLPYARIVLLAKYEALLGVLEEPMLTNDDRQRLVRGE